MGFFVLLDNGILHKVLIDNTPLSLIKVSPDINEDHGVYNAISAYRYSPLSHFVALYLDLLLNAIREEYGAKDLHQLENLINLGARDELQDRYLSYINKIYHKHEEFFRNVKFVSLYYDGGLSQLRFNDFSHKFLYVKICKHVFNNFFNEYKSIDLISINKNIHKVIKDYLACFSNICGNGNYMCVITNREIGNQFHNFR